MIPKEQNNIIIYIYSSPNLFNCEFSDFKNFIVQWRKRFMSN